MSIPATQVYFCGTFGLRGWYSHGCVALLLSFSTSSRIVVSEESDCGGVFHPVHPEVGVISDRVVENLAGPTLTYLDIRVCADKHSSH